MSGISTPAIQLNDMPPNPSEMTEAKDFAANPKSPTLFYQHSPFDNSMLEPPEDPLTETISATDSEYPAEDGYLNQRRRSMSHHLMRTDIPSREWLHVQANFWRACMRLGMLFHDWAPPRAPRPAFKHEIRTDTVPIELFFYLPPNYHNTLDSDAYYRFPAVINFHGGGFVLGDASDDRYWARVAMERTNAIFVSVNYRRAPEHPFPVPVDDCAEAILYVAEHATELNIDPGNIALSGFSAGANLAFAAPLRIQYHYGIDVINGTKSSSPTRPGTSETDMSNREDPYSDDHSFLSVGQSTASLIRAKTMTPLRIRSIVAWYPLLDWTMSRSRKIRESRNPKKCLSKTFTDLFDVSYLPPPDVAGDHCSPYASPGLAQDHMIRDGLPQEMQMWLCEWDMLLAEGQQLADKFERLGKNVDSKMIPRVPHAWDKSVNPFRDQKAIDMLYTKSAINLNKVFQDKDGIGWGNSMSSLHPADTIIERQPRHSVVMPL
ncbi:uncharacterized protein A1O9_04861 [Exophiala aquamarina CBS 119918]|uniref:Alpha/beta hydrolase fold-3 domain-containing protein n=1 Tax=Exophiala aquamarina CBS 119918 TaxID=1182545 RepID=A0A072PJE4_9EURO|nr:uncharacterized protein A1O9_04861 [Exophiala aquamarina CBS 119918]KEF60011.1 hypothetical protein A1O9_04861 [Exophiala aquamarina CBS 119918]